jgi:glycosyltransferase involved in cell wall biosynthesis
MRLALLTNNRFPPREGIARHVLEVGTRLRALGHEVTVLARGEAWSPWAETLVGGLKVRHFPHFPLRPFHHALARHELDAWLEAGAGGAELLHVHLPLLPALKTRLPIVATVHSPMLHDTGAIAEPGLKPALIKANARLFSCRYEQWYLDHAAAVVAVSHQVADELGAAYRLRGRRPSVVPNGVDTGFFGFVPPEDRRGGLLYVGRLGYRKGLLRLLEAFARLPHRPGFELTLAGEGPLEPELRRRAKALGIAERLRFTGFLDRGGVRAELQRAACFVNPADYESGPLTLLEAMACGVPVVTTPTGLAAEMGLGAPLLVVGPDPDALALGVDEVLADPDAAATRARAARALVVASFGWDRVVAALERIYRLRLDRAA